MAKSDFEFYEIPGIAGEFVMPAPDCDPYGGQYHPWVIGETAINRIVDAANTEFEAETTVTQQTLVGVPRRSYLFNNITAGVDVVGANVKISADLGEKENEFYAFPIRRLGTVLANIPRTLPPQSQPKGTKSTHKAVKVIFDPQTPEIYDFLDNSENQPADPVIFMQQIIPVRAFKWLPGRSRKSEAGCYLPPTYSARPVGLVFAQHIEITGLNPDVERQTAT